MVARDVANSVKRIVWTRADTIAMLSITLVAGALRLIRLGDPPDIMFDETYYAKDACWYVKASSSLCEVEYEQTGVHPPLGKWLLAIGIRLFGYDAFGWRLGAAVAGTLTVALLYVLGRRLLGSTLGASMAAGLLAIDFLHFVQSRIAMLDVFVPLFVVAAFLFVVLDRERLLPDRNAPPDEEDTAEEQEPVERSPAGIFGRPWRIAAGAAAGAAVASKWSGGLALPAIILLTLAWETAARRRERGRVAAFGRALLEEGPNIVLWLMVLPLIVYVLTYAGRIDGALLAAPWTEGTWLNQWWDKQVGMWDFHANLTASHPYQSPGWTWILLKRPVSYFFQSNGTSDYREVIALGNPFVWWASILAILYVVARWLRSRTLGRPEGVILAGVFFNYVPWLIPITDRGAVFIFYLLPTLPFMCLALGYVAERIGATWEARAAQVLFVVGAVGLFVFYYPILAKTSISRAEWDKRIWVFGKTEWCQKIEGGTLTTETVTQTTGTVVTTQTSVTTKTDDLPPKGWCWI